jgi:outer membrane autotransporter protein
VDYAHATQTADHLDIMNVAVLSGNVAVSPMNAEWTQSGTTTVTLASAAGGVSLSEVSLVAPGSLITQYAIKQSATDMLLEVVTDFAPKHLPGLTANQAAIGEYLNKGQSGDNAATMTPMIETLVSITDAASLHQAYDQLSPEGHPSVYVSQLVSSLRFGDALLSCKSRDGDYYFAAEQECGWLSIGMHSENHDAHASTSGYERDVDTVAGGLQWALNDRWYAGLAVSFEKDDIQTQSREGFTMQSASGYAMHLGAVLKGVFGNTTWSTSLSGSFSDHDTERRAFSSPHRARSDQDILQAALQMRLAHAFDFNRWYLRPMVDVGVTRMDLDGFRERGASTSNLIVSGTDDEFWHVRPAVEAGVEATLGENVARLSARFGVTRLSDDNIELSGALEGAPLDAGSFQVTHAMDRTVREWTAGMDLFSSSGFVVRVGYSGQFSANSHSNGGAVRFMWPL